MTTHHIRETQVNGVMVTWCGLEGFKGMGGTIEIGRKLFNCTSSPKPGPGSCAACVRALPAKFKPPSLYTALRDELRREPTNAELTSFVLYVAECDAKAGRSMGELIRVMNLRGVKPRGVPKSEKKRKAKK
jgi:hypothetical protein